MNTPIATDKVSEVTQQAADSARQMAHTVLQGAQHAVETTRSATDATLERAEYAFDGLRREVDPAIHDLAAKAQALANQSIHYCARTGEHLRQQVDTYRGATTDYVKQNPGRSVLMALATGAALATAALLMSRRRHA